MRDEELKNLEFKNSFILSSLSDNKQKNQSALFSTKNSRHDNFNYLFDECQKNTDENLFIAKYNNTVKTNILRRKLLFSRMRKKQSNEMLITPLRKKAEIWFKWGKLIKHALTEMFYLNINRSNQIIKNYHLLSFWNIINYNISMVIALLRMNSQNYALEDKDLINKSDIVEKNLNIQNISSKANYNTHQIKIYQAHLKSNNEPFIPKHIPLRNNSKSSNHSRRIIKNNFE